MKFSEPKSFRDAMSPVIRACWVFGVGIFEYPSGHRRVFLSFCWSIAHLALFLRSVSLARVPEVSFLQESTVAGHNYHLSNCCCIIFMTTSMIVAWKAKTTMGWNRLINVVNKKLIKFEIPEDYGIAFKHQITQLTVCLLQIIFILAFSFYQTNSEDFWELPNIAFWISVHYQLAFTYVIGCSYCGFVRYIGNRFHRLNAYLLQSNSNGKDTEPFLQDSGNRRWTVHVLREARSIHHNLCFAVEEMNQAFGIQIISFVGISFCDITSLLFTIYQICTIPASISTSYQYLEMFPGCCWLVTHLTSVYYIVHCCSMVSHEAHKTGQLIHERAKPDTSSDVQTEIDAFSLQLIHNPLQFTAHGFFTLDYGLIRGMAGSVTTYLVIMIQLRGIYDPKPDFTSSRSSVENSTSPRNLSISL